MIGQVEAPNVPIAKLEKHSVRMVCSNCHKEVFTHVQKKISKRGVLWAILCFCFGGFYLSLLVLFMDVFKEFTHHCPSCNSIAGRYMPPLPAGVICLFICLIVGAITIDILVIVFAVIGTAFSYEP